MFNFLIRFTKWIVKNKNLTFILYLLLPVFSFYINLYKNYSWDLMSISLLFIFVLRIITSVTVAVYILSFIKNPNIVKSKNGVNRKVKARKLIGVLLLKILIGGFIIVTPLIYSKNYTTNYITEKINNESLIVNAKIYDLKYWNNHLSGSKGYQYEFYIKEKRFTGRHTEKNGKIGKRIQVVYFKDIPWVNKKHE